MYYSFAVIALQLSTALASADYGFGSNKVLYFQDNDPSGNSVISVQVSGRDGKLSSAVRTRTGGLGAVGLFAPSQDSVKVAGNYLFATNGGSNTLSAFAIDPRDPLHPRLLGKPAATLGHIPVSVAYSQRLNTVCAVNGGSDLAGVTCFSVHPEQGLVPLGPMRPIKQSGVPAPAAGTPPVILTGDIVFNPSSTALFTSVGDPSGGPGTLLAFPIAYGQVSQSPVSSSLKDLNLVFSLNFLGSDSRLFATNPHNNSPGAAVLSVSPNHKVYETQIITIPGQVASCWVADSRRLDTLFVIDAAKPTITTIDPWTGKVTSQFGFTTPSLGAIDSVASEQYVYTLTVPFNSNLTAFVASPQVLVYDASPIERHQSPQLLQSFDIFKAVGQIPNIQGLAIYPAA